MPRRSAALASRRQAGSSAACRPEVYDAHCGRPLIWALGGGLDRGWGRRLLVYRVGASRVLPLFRLFFGGSFELLKDQFVAALVVGVFSFVVTYALAKTIDATMGLRVGEDAEYQGLDQSQHAESAYTG